MSKEKLIEKIFERVLLPEHDSPELKEEIAQNLSRVSEKVLGWLENRIEIALIKAKNNGTQPIDSPQAEDSGTVPSAEEIRATCIGILQRGESFLEAIKYYRRFVPGGGLRQAKEYIDALRAELAGTRNAEL